MRNLYYSVVLITTTPKEIENLVRTRGRVYTGGGGGERVVTISLLIDGPFFFLFIFLFFFPFFSGNDGEIPPPHHRPVMCCAHLCVSICCLGKFSAIKAASPDGRSSQAFLLISPAKAQISPTCNR